MFIAWESPRIASCATYFKFPDLKTNFFALKLSFKANLVIYSKSPDFKTNRIASETPFNANPITHSISPDFRTICTAVLYPFKASLALHSKDHFPLLCLLLFLSSVLASAWILLYSYYSPFLLVLIYIIFSIIYSQTKKPSDLIVIGLFEQFTFYGNQEIS